jgi:hypothetical protein
MAGSVKKLGVFLAIVAAGFGPRPGGLRLPAGSPERIVVARQADKAYVLRLDRGLHPARSLVLSL